MTMQRIMTLTKKEILHTIREPANLFLVFLFPLILTLAFGVAFGAIGAGGDIQYIIGIVDHDSTAWSISLAEDISATDVLIVNIIEEDSMAYDDLAQGKLSAVLIIPAGFGESIDSFFANPNDSGSWDETVLELSLDQGSMIAGTVVPSFIQQGLAVTMFGEAALSTPGPVTIGTPKLVESIKLSQFDYMVPGMFSYAAIFISMIVAQVFTEERQQGVLKRISVTPTSSLDIFLGQMVANLTTGIVQVFIVYSASTLMGFRPMGGILGVAVAMISVLLLILCNVGLGLITATIAKSPGAATGVAFVFILPQMFLGTFVPAPESVSRIVPSYYVTQTLTNIFLRGAAVTSETVITNLGILTLYSIGITILGVIIYSKFGNK